MGAPTTTNAAKAWLKKHGQLNERALAEVFTEEFESRWRYNADEGYWLQWVGTHWARRQTLEFLDALGSFMAGFVQIFRKMDEITHSEAVKLKKQQTVSALEKICRGMPSFLARSALFDADPFLLGTPGGTIDLRTGIMQPAVPDDYITVLTTVTPAPPGTPLGPLFKQFLHDITSGDGDFAKTLQQWFGISAQGTSRDQLILFLYGAGGNGKGVLLRTIAGLLGDHAVNAPRDMLTTKKYSQHTTHLVDVLNARMAIATEIDDDTTWDTALVKDITGGDPMSVQRMRQDPYRITAKCTPTVSSNHKPALKGIDDAIKRRFLTATFKLKVKKPIPELEKIFIKQEGPSILRWVIDGSVARCNSPDGLFIAPVILEDTDDYFKEENVIEDFIHSYMEPAPGKKVKTSAVYATWKAVCVASGRAFGAQNSFTTAMRAAGIEYHRSNAGRYFLNYNLLLVPKEPPAEE